MNKLQNALNLVAVTWSEDLLEETLNVLKRIIRNICVCLYALRSSAKPFIELMV